MKSIRKFLFYWGPPLAWMTIIFTLSSRKRVTLSETYAINFVIFKILHMIEYAILYFLLHRAYAKRKKLKAPFLISVAYAASDEIHQYFVPTREGTARDVLIDTLGITIMYIYIKSRIKK